MLRRKPPFLRFLTASLSFLCITSCQLFEADVADFMEKYTETAAIEAHEFNVETYNDQTPQLCIASEEDAVISLYMRNPKKFTLIPTVEFINLDSTFSTSDVTINQDDTNTITLSLPQKFLVPVDEGQDITAKISLKEPMSGRDFDRYTVDVHCNTIPPQILNPTILNKNNEQFVLAFDMPNEYEVAVRHKDLTEVVINGKSYPLSVTTKDDTDLEDTKYAEYTFTDSACKRERASSYIAINDKDFTHNSRTSVYVETGDPFLQNEHKEFTLTLKDRAGLSSTVTASTVITKLQMPQILDQNGVEITEGGLTGIPFDEDQQSGSITIIPPTKDHKGKTVPQTTVYYKVYQATGSGLLYTSGSTTEAKTIELPQDTYRVEAYAKCIGYENSATNTVIFRFMNNALFVTANASSGDGSPAHPYATISEALADIQARENKEARFTIYLEGNFTVQTTDKEGLSGSYGEIILSGDINTNELVIKKNKASSQAILKNLKLNTLLDPSVKVTIGNITITNSSGNGIDQESDAELTLDGAIITECSDSGVYANNGSLKLKSGTISENAGFGILLDSVDSCIISGGIITKNGSADNNAALQIGDSSCSITNVNITDNFGAGIKIGDSSTLNLSGGSITANKGGGILVSKTETLKIEGNPVVTGNTKVFEGQTTATTANVLLQHNDHTDPITPKIVITGALTAGCNIGIHIDEYDITNGPQPLASIGGSYLFANNYSNTDSPSLYFTSDQGYSIIKDGSGVSLTNSGSSGGQQLATDYNIQFSAETNAFTGITTGSAKVVTLTPIATVNSNPVSCTISSEGQLIVDGTAVSLTAAIYNGGTPAADLTVTVENAGDNKLKITIPAITYPNDYVLKITALYLGITHETNFSFTVAVE